MFAVRRSYCLDAQTQEMKFFGPRGASPCAVTYAAESPPSTMKSCLSVKNSTRYATVAVIYELSSLAKKTAA